MSADAVRAIAVALVGTLLSGGCAGGLAPPPEGGLGLGRAVHVAEVRFHGHPADPALPGDTRLRLEQALGGDGASPDAAKTWVLRFQFTRLEAGRSLRPLAWPLAIATLGLWPSFGPGAWRVDARLFGRLRVRDGAGCRSTEVQASLDYPRYVALTERAPPPDFEELRELALRLTEGAARRLELGVARGGAGGCPAVAS